MDKNKMMDEVQLYTLTLANNKVKKALFNPNPCWVWSKRATRILWSNEAGCRFFDTKSLPDLLGRTFRPVSPATVEIARTSDLLKKGESREIDLRFFRGINPITLPAKLERLQLENGQNVVFVRVLEAPTDLELGNPNKDKTRLMKLFSRGDEAVALINDKGKIEEASLKFQEDSPDKSILKEALHKAKKSKTNFYSYSLKKGRLLSLCLIGKKGHECDFVFASISDKANSFISNRNDDPILEDVQKSKIDLPDTIEEVPQLDTTSKTIVSLDDAEDGDLPPFIFERKKSPTRFMFSFDETESFTSISKEFSEAFGPETGNLIGESWADLSERYNLDPKGTIAEKINQQAIWTETINWPVSLQKEGENRLHVPVTITAMPVFNAVREFEGFRGFGSINTYEAAIKPSIPLSIETEKDIVETTSSPDNAETIIKTPEINETLSLQEQNTTDLAWQEEESDIAFENVQLETDEDDHNDNDEQIVPIEETKIVPLHSRPVAVSSPTQDEQQDSGQEDLSALSKPEQDAFKQIAAALNARIEGEEASPEKIDEEVPSSTIEEKTSEEFLEGNEETSSDIKSKENFEKPVFYEEEFDAADIVEGHKKPKSWPLQNLKPRAVIAKAVDAHITHPTDTPAKLETAKTNQVNLLNRLPVGIIVSRDRNILFANKTVLDFLGYHTSQSLEEAGGINDLFIADTNVDPGSFIDRDFLKHLVVKADNQEGHIPQAVQAKKANGDATNVNLRLQSGQWEGEDALLMAITERDDEAPSPLKELKEGMALSQLLGQSTDIMDIASDGILIINETGRLLHANTSAEALFNRNKEDMLDTNLISLFADESQKSVADYLDGLTANGVLSVLNDGREVIGQESNGGLIPLFITIGRLEKNEHLEGGVFCVVLRDITQWKRAEEELIESRRIAETANAQKSDFLATISHEIRTPLNAIIGFSEVMMGEHFGPMQNTRYLEYAHDIHQSGKHLVSLVNDLLDLSKIEAGKMDMTFAAVDLNPVVQECVALMQPDANRDRIIIRTSLSENLPAVVADIRSIRQIILNLLSNGVKFTKAGGQVIISTTIEENGEVALRVRDTGIGMSESDLDYAMQPFQQLDKNSGEKKVGTGLGLPLTKALAEANRADFSINSRVNYGTLIQVIFPNERVLAQ